MEEITDNRPRTVSVVNDFAEQGYPALKVSQEIAEKFTETYMNVQIYRTNRDNGEETLLETIQIDISCLLFPTKNAVEVIQTSFTLKFVLFSTIGNSTSYRLKKFFL